MINEALGDMWFDSLQYCMIPIESKREFCSAWHKYAPRLCKWIMENKIGFDDWEECLALFASEMKRANKLYERDMRKKEILDASVAFHL